MKFINDLGDYLSQEAHSPVWVLYILGLIFLIFTIIVVNSALSVGLLEKELENEIFIKDSLQQEVERKEKFILELKSVLKNKTERIEPVEKVKSSNRRPSTRNEKIFSDKVVPTVRKPRQRPE